MNRAMSIQRLSNSIRHLIESDPAIRPRVDQAERLEDILGSTQWAKEWIEHNQGTKQLQVLKEILIRYAALPFEIEQLLKGLEDFPALTGADVRVAVAKLRRSGIIFAVRKAWGDQLLYLPTDNIPIWLPLLLPLNCEPVPIGFGRDIQYASAEYRLPLSLELLSVWHEIYRQPIAWTVKGAPQRTSITRITGAMKLTAEEVSCLALTYPHQEHCPAQAAMALDLGLVCKVLIKDGNEIDMNDSGLTSWLTHSPSSADVYLHNLVMHRYGALDRLFHLTASVIHSMPIMEWIYEEQAVIVQDQMESIISWLGLLESFGWLERGMVNGKAVFRKKKCLDERTDYVKHEPGTLIVQPDGEVLVPPDVGLSQRWMLEEIAERGTADELFVYRLTRNACIKACNAGLSQEAVVQFLERESRAPLPESVVRALTDWYSSLGKVSFAEVMLLRTENDQISNELKRDPAIAEKLLEQVGDCAFIVDVASYRLICARLRKMGYPPLEQTRRIRSDSMDSIVASDMDGLAESGWIYKSTVLSAYESDRTMPAAEELFPGMLDIPAFWISRPRAYHASTCKELIERAIRWQAPIQLKHNEKTRIFIPKGIEEANGRWSVRGQWSSEQKQLNPVRIQPDEFSEVMILLPSMEELETN